MTIQESYSVVASIGNFTFHFFGLILFSMAALSYLCHKWCALASKYHIQTVFDVTHSHIVFVCYWPFNRFVEHIRNCRTNMCLQFQFTPLLCFIVNTHRGQYEMDFEINLISIKIHTRKAPNDRDKTIKYARISISYNDNYDRYKYFIRQ